MVGRQAVLVIVALCGANAAHARPVTRSGVTWTAQPVIGRHDNAVTLSWTVTARGTDKRARRVPCVSFTIAEEFGEVVKGQYSAKGAGFGLRAEPANACAPEGTQTVTARTTWRFDVPPAEHAELRAGDAMRARIAIRIGDAAAIELGAVTLSVGDDGKPKLTTLAPRKP